MQLVVGLALTTYSFLVGFAGRLARDLHGDEGGFLKDGSVSPKSFRLQRSILQPCESCYLTDQSQGIAGHSIALPSP